MVVTQPVFAESVMVVSDSGRVVSSFGHLVSVNSGSSGGVMVMDHDSVGMVVSSFGGEVSVDGDVSVTGEFHVLSTEGSLSLSVAGPVFPVGEETHVHVGFLGNLVASALRFLGLVAVSLNSDVIAVDVESVTTTASDTELKADDITGLHLFKDSMVGGERAGSSSVVGNTEDVLGVDNLSVSVDNESSSSLAVSPTLILPVDFVTERSSMFSLGDLNASHGEESVGSACIV
jgi:hypothetical protein